MDGFISLISLVLIAAIPLFIASLFLVWRKYAFGPIWFFSAILSGTIALFAAAFIQSFFSPIPETAGMAAVLFKIFIQIALTEEGAKLILLILFFKLSSRLAALGPGDYPSHATATGLVAGLGFALLETISYARADLRIALVRSFSAAPLHAACGARTSVTAASIFRHEPDLKGFIYALLIHGMYNFLVVSPAIPDFVPLILVLMVLVPSIVQIKRKENDL